MKYLNMYESYDVDGVNKFLDDIKSTINWNIIEDAKEMALEYIDEGLTLHILIINTSLKHFNNLMGYLYELNYNHNKNSVKTYFDINGTEMIYRGYYKSLKLSNCKLKYYIYLYNMNNYNQYYYESNELINRLKETYPNENIINNY